ncbi:phage protein NinX family protein [Winslowiella arboricola]|uniref:phage protein NinX family protein n=1 Tax=Winslowiella arboricola TaxID=2978220 RepID=UPI00225DF26A|nr:phage protein NinX family protein [Winslowiella arboricola]MCU5775207.1 DUF2591 domain-containing protein [Winslowiella arboricola]
MTERELNIAVAEALGMTVEAGKEYRTASEVYAGFISNGNRWGWRFVDFCNDWSLTGALIEQHGICLLHVKSKNFWAAGESAQHAASSFWREKSNRPLVAALKCLIQIKAREQKITGNVTCHGKAEITIKPFEVKA